MTNLIPLPQLKATGKGSCDGGHHPHPPFHDFPLLAWSHAGHPKFGSSVFLEDQTASVTDIATALPTMPDLKKLAAKFGTTEDHVSQAIDYAIRASVLGR